MQARELRRGSPRPILLDPRRFGKENQSSPFRRYLCVRNSNGSALKHLVMILEFRGGYNHRRPVRPRLSSALTATMSFRFYLFENLLQNPKGFVSKGSSELLDAAFNSVCECLIIPSDCYSRPYGRKGTLYEFVSPFLIKLRTFLL